MKRIVAMALSLIILATAMPMNAYAMVSDVPLVDNASVVQEGMIEEITEPDENESDSVETMEEVTSSEDALQIESTDEMYSEELEESSDESMEDVEAGDATSAIKSYTPTVFLDYYSSIRIDKKVSLFVEKDSFPEVSGYTCTGYDIYRADTAIDEFRLIETVNELGYEEYFNDYTVLTPGSNCKSYTGYLCTDNSPESISFNRSFFRYKLVLKFSNTSDPEAEPILTQESNIINLNGMYYNEMTSNGDQWNYNDKQEGFLYAYVADENNARVTEIELCEGETSPKLHLVKVYKDGKELHSGISYLKRKEFWGTASYLFDAKESIYLWKNSDSPTQVSASDYAFVQGMSVKGERSTADATEQWYVCVQSEEFESHEYYILLPLTIVPAEEDADYEASKKVPVVYNSIAEMRRGVLDAITTYDFEKEYEFFYNPDTYEEDFDDHSGKLDELIGRFTFDTADCDDFAMYDFNEWSDDTRPKEGDYLYYETMGRIDTNVDYYWYRDKAYPRLTVKVHRLPYALGDSKDTRQNEKQVDQKVKALFGAGGELAAAKSGSDYDKIKRIYEYCSKNVVWGNALTDSLYYTAWSAAIKGVASCQGQAVWFYRLAREAGVPCRVVGVAGESKSGSATAHTFNIVRIQGKWYVIDSGASTFALRGTKSSGYNPDYFYPIYHYGDFVENFPVSVNDYTYIEETPSAIASVKALTSEQLAELGIVDSAAAESMKADYSINKTSVRVSNSGDVGLLPISALDGNKAVLSHGSGANRFYLGYRIAVNASKISTGATLKVSYIHNGEKLIREFDAEALKRGYADVVLDVTGSYSDIKAVLDMDTAGAKSKYSPTTYTFNTSALQRGASITGFKLDDKTTFDIDFDKLGIGSKVEYPFEITPVIEDSFIREMTLSCLRWKSSNPAIASVTQTELNEDGTGKITIVPYGYGQAIITGEIENKKVSVTVSVYPVTKGHGLRIEADKDIARGIQPGEKVQLRVVDDVNGKVISSTYFKFESSNGKAVTVSNRGVLTGMFDSNDHTLAKKSTITATLYNDLSNRKVSVVAVAVPPQIDKIRVAPVTGEGIEVLADGTLVVDRAAIASAPLTFEVNTYEVKEGDAEVPLSVPAVWSTSDPKIATATYVASAKKSRVTILKGSVGEVQVKATVNDRFGASDSIRIQIRDYSPRLSTSAVAINSRMSSGALIDIMSGYGNTIHSATLIDAGTKASQSAAGLKLTEVSTDSMGGKNYAIEKESAETLLAKGTRNIKIQIETDESIYELPLTVKIIDTIPEITLRQAAKFNQFYSDSEARIAVAAKGASIANVELKDAESSPYEIAYNSMTGDICVTWNSLHEAATNADVSVDSKLVLKVYLEDYIEPVEKSIKLATSLIKPAYALRSDKINYYSALKASDTPKHQAAVTIYDKKSKTDIDISDSEGFEASIVSQTVENSFEGAKLVDGDGRVMLNLNLNSDGLFSKNATSSDSVASSKATVSIRKNNWRMPLNFNVKVTVRADRPVMKLSTGTLRLNRVFPTATYLAYTDAEISTSNVLADDEITVSAEVESAYPEFDKRGKPVEAYAEAQKIVVGYYGGVISARFDDMDNLPKTGTYKYIVKPKLTLKDSSVIELNAVNVSVKVDAAIPQALPTSVTVNTKILEEADNACGITRVNLAANKDALLVRMAGGNNMAPLLKNTSQELGIAETKPAKIAEAAKLNVTYQDGYITADFIDTTNLPKAGKYAFTYYPEYIGANTRGAAKVVTVEVLGGARSVTVSAKGKIDLVKRDYGITYTTTKLKNISDKLDTVVSLSGEDADKFEVTYDSTTATGQIVAIVTAKSDAALEKGRVYKYSLCYKAIGNSNVTVMSPIQKVKAVQSNVKVARQNAKVYTMYQASMKGRTYIDTINLTTPVDVTIGQVRLSDDNSVAIKEVFQSGFAAYIEPDGRTAQIKLAPNSGSPLKAGVTYKVKVDVVPDGNGTNVKPVCVIIPVKILK